MKITRESVLEEVITHYPQTVEVFIRFGMPCFVCGEPAWGTVGENIDRQKVTDPDALLEELNKVIQKTNQETDG